MWQTTMNGWSSTKHNRKCLVLCMYKLFNFTCQQVPRNLPWCMHVYIWVDDFLKSLIIFQKKERKKKSQWVVWNVKEMKKMNTKKTFQSWVDDFLLVFTRFQILKLEQFVVPHNTFQNITIMSMIKSRVSKFRIWSAIYSPLNGNGKSSSG